MLVDCRRVRPFEVAIAKFVRSSDVVVDVGTGSGLLAILCARAGARKVYAVEVMANMRRIAEANFRAEKLPALQLPIIDADARTMHLAEAVDVVVCELLSTWSISEQQVEVARALRPSMRPGARMIPNRMFNFITGVQAPLDYDGTRICFPYYVRELRESRPLCLTERVLTHVTDFEHIQETDVRIGPLAMRTLGTGVINAVLVESVATMGDDTPIDSGQTLFLPHVIPLHSPRVLNKSPDHVTVSCSYSYGNGWDRFSCSVN
jgi:predicted RNA methylase